ncbi:MAG: anaerobic ribonucleoside-triphosphate reductase activating protein [Oceanospirillaceae bacterium]|nr:anaerobic ribonucleoside-triphosphate reductase activating protein [Oceanospirillaceae bacterium]MCP5349697.1 anaerobic ribonucleoside-triphosphate reductase activating protein [Oceanospirillaceae bacterium]
MAALRIGGLTPLTTLDYPGHLASVVFLQGCAWRCRYCHNPELMDAGAPTEIDWADVLHMLHERREFIDAVVFSGGEPLLQNGLEDAIAEVKAMGLKVALHTSGMVVKRFAQLLPQLDWVALDIKHLPAQTDLVTQVEDSGHANWAALTRLLVSETPYEVRTTAHPQLISADGIMRLALTLQGMGVENYALQISHNQRCFDPKLSNLHYDPLELKELEGKLSGLFPHFEIRH